MQRERISTRAAGRALAAASLALALAACGGEGEAREVDAAAPETVLGAADVATVERAALARSVAVTGTLDPYRVAEVRAQVPGTLAGLRVDRGQAVGRGQVMATIQAEGVRSQAAGAQAGVAAARAALALADKQLESARTLYAAGAISEIELRSAQAQHESAQAQLAAARAQAAGAGEQARRATVVAPFTGEVSRRTANEGEAVNVGQALFTVVNTDVLELAGRVPVEQAAGIRAGQPVEFEVSGYPGRVFRGEVARVEPTADAATRQVGVYVRLPNPGRGLLGGLFATGRILSGETEEVAVVPTAALRRDGTQAYVRVVRDGAVERRPVTPGAADSARGVTAVTEGLQAGERVVVAQGEIQEGARVRVETGTGEPAATRGR